jgi:hypothetical protein
LLKVVRGTANINTLSVKVADGATYNLAGQKVADGFKGIGIRNGKKVVLK